MIRLIGSAVRKSNVPIEKGKAKAVILKLISQIKELDKGLSYYKGLEIVSHKKMKLDPISRPIFNGFCTLSEENGKTTVNIKIKTYWYIEMVLVLGLLGVISWLSMYFLNPSMLSNKQGQFTDEVYLFISIIALGISFVRNYVNKKIGVESIEELLSMLESEYNNK